MSEEKDLKNFYDDNFYDEMTKMSIQSAEIYANYLSEFVQPSSVIDLGCGRGAWLKAFKDCGSSKLKGIDGDWIDREDLMDEAIIFEPLDLNKLDLPKEKYDLAMSLEVAEHLEVDAGENFVKFLTNSSDLILFGSAYKNQGGTNHINEQKHSYWANKFVSNGFLPFDFFREEFWNNDHVGFWYRQNIFLYIKKESTAFNEFVEKGFSPLTNLYFMDCVHPDLYDSKCGEGISFSTHLKGIVPSLIRAIKRRMTS
jgi:SAM-dependent methyltransferase